MSAVTIYDLVTRLAVARGSAGIAVPAGCVAVDGLHDLRRTRLAVVVDDFGGETYRVAPVLPARPADTDLMTWGWDEEADAWVSTLTVQGQKVARWERIKVWRDQAEQAPLLVDGRTYDADQDSQRRIACAVQLAQLGGSDWVVDWTLADNSVVTLDAPQMFAVGVALGQQVATAHAIARQLRVQLDTAPTVSAVRSIVWPGDGHRSDREVVHG